MKPFRFSLEAVLGLRWIAYQNALSAYLKCTSVYQALEVQLNSEHALRDRVCQSMIHHRAALFSVGLQCQYDQTLVLLRTKIREMSSDLASLREDCLKAQQLMLKAKQAYEIVLKVKQKAVSNYRAECVKEQERS